MTAESNRNRPEPDQLTQFEQLYIRQLFLDPLLSILIEKASRRSLENHNLKLKQLWSRRSFQKLDKPQFYYSHAVSPHPPFTVDKEGALTMRYPDFQSINDGSHATKNSPQLVAQYKLGYIEKLKFTNSQILPLLKFILLEVPGEKIVIVHGDHGGGSMFDHDDATNTCFRERFSPFYALYSSQGSIVRTINNDQPFTIVNTYRLILSGLFSESLSTLTPRSFFIPWGNPENAMELSQASLDSCSVM